jgi:broad specificity phosphatase PhoE
MKVYLVRHGETLSRHGLNHIEGADISLSIQGQKEAERAGRYLKGKGVAVLIASPMARAKETAEIISQELNLLISFDDRLAEHAPSHTLTGQAFKEAKARTRRERDHVPEEGESFNQSADRFIKVLDDVASKKKNIAVISHALVMQNTLVKMFNLETFPVLDTGSVTILSYENDAWHLALLNKRSNFFFHFFTCLKQRFL